MLAPRDAPERRTLRWRFGRASSAARLSFLYLLRPARILWLAVFTEGGYLNSSLQGAGLIQQPILFLSFENLPGILTAIVVAESWRATAIVLLILIAGLQLIPRDFFEAADVFGAGRFRRAIHVGLPLLRPSLASALIIRTLLGLPA